MAALCNSLLIQNDKIHYCNVQSGVYNTLDYSYRQAVLS